MSGATAPQAGTTTAEPFHYAVVDLASASGLRAPVGRLLPSAALSLFGDAQPAALRQVGPWLIRLSNAPEIAPALKRFGPDVAWGFHLYSTFDIASLRRSLRRFNLVQLEPKRKQMLFRYWDPRVMRVFLDVATPDQKRRLFELVERIEIGGARFEAPEDRAQRPR